MKKKLIPTFTEFSTAIVTVAMAVLCSGIYYCTRGENRRLEEAEIKQVK